MRHAVALLAALLLAACAPQPKLPQIADQTPYPEVRSRMIAAGFIPQRVVERTPHAGEPPRTPDWCPGDHAAPFCRAFPELAECSDGMLSRCRWIYRAGEHGPFVVVRTRCRAFGGKDCFEGADVVGSGRSDDVKVAGSALFAPQPTSADLPQIAEQTLYPEVRRRMIAAGFIPQRIVQRRLISGEPPRGEEWCPALEDTCKLFPELMECSLGPTYCRWMYRESGSGRIVIVYTTGELGAEARFVDRAYAEGAEDLADFVVSGPAVVAPD